MRFKFKWPSFGRSKAKKEDEKSTDVGTAEDKMEVDEDNKNYDANQIDVEDNDSENKTEAAINDTVSIFKR